ncbi:hypothetical protein LT493_11890 [Streptomyces tricolor]|nr:hypothetical protein [Streptomyces tricolor]
MQLLPDVFLHYLRPQRHPLQRRDAGDPVPRQEHRRGAGDAHRGGAGVLRPESP